MAVEISQILSTKTPLGHIHIHQHHKVRPVLILFYGHGIFHPAYCSITCSIDLMGFLILSFSDTLLFSLSSSFSNLSVHNLLVYEAFLCFPRTFFLQNFPFFIRGWWLGSEGRVIKTEVPPGRSIVVAEWEERKDGGKGAENRGLDDHET